MNVPPTGRRGTELAWPTRPNVASPALLLLLLASLIGGSLPVLGHGLPIAGTDDTHDVLVTHGMDWEAARDAEDPRIVDLVSKPHPATEPPAELPSSAFRFHGDVGWVEGTLVHPGNASTEPRALFNTGLRLQSVRFDPPLVNGEHTLARIDLPLLDIDETRLDRNPDARDPTFERIRLETLASVPMPDAGGLTPPTQSNADSDGDEEAPANGSGLEVRTRLVISEIGESHPDLGDLGSATTRLRIELTDRSADWTVAEGTRMSLIGLIDLAAAANTTMTTPTTSVDAYGLQFDRDPAYAWVRVSAYSYPARTDAASAWGSHEPRDRPDPLTATFEAIQHPGRPLDDTARSHLGPLRVNATTGDLHGEPLDVALDWHLGYAYADAALLHDEPDMDADHNEGTAHDSETPGTSVAWLVTGILMLALIARKHWRT